MVRRVRHAWIVVCLCVVWPLGVLGCGDDDAPVSEEPTAAVGDLASSGEVVDPPFAVRGDLEGLLLTWFDAEGAHSAERRTDIPESARAEVRVDSLALSPDERDADSVFVADVRTPDAEGRYTVRRVAREAFEARARQAREAVAAAPAAGASGEIVIFGASWCGACRQAEGYLRSRGVAFVERDIETEPGAREDMLRRARAAGISPNGIPIIDIRGRVMQGFDVQAIDRALAETGGVGAPAAPATPSAPSTSGVTI